MRKDMNNLRTVADEMMADLHADERLRQRILHAAQKSNPGFFSPRTLRILAPVTCALLVTVGTLYALPMFKTTPPSEPAVGQGVHIETVAAGSQQSSSAPLQIARADVPDDSIVVVPNQNEGPKFESIYATMKGENYPMLGMYGHAYRQVKGALSGNAIGDSLGTVAQKTAEPSLADGDMWQNSILSNVAEEGAPVYSVNGLSTDAAVAAEVGGKVYLFQRVSFSGYGVNGQSLGDVLGIYGGLDSLVLSGVGTVSDSGRAQDLISALTGRASFYSDELTRGKQGLIIKLSNGARLQLFVSGEVFSACGSWSCPEFFDDFASAMD